MRLLRLLRKNNFSKTHWDHCNSQTAGIDSPLQLLKGFAGDTRRGDNLCVHIWWGGAGATSATHATEPQMMDQEELRSNQQGWRYMKISYDFMKIMIMTCWISMKEVWWMKMTSCLLPFGPLGTSRWLVARIGKLRGGTVPPSDGRLRKIDTFAKESIALWKHRNPKHRSNSREGVDVLHYVYSNFFA